MGAPMLQPIEPAAEVSPLEMPFTAIMSKEAAVQMRESLDVTKNRDMLALYAFLVIDRSAMVDMIKSVFESDGADEAMVVLEAISGVRENLAEVARLAEMVEARAMISMHVALGLTLEDTAGDPTPWDAARADEAAARAVLNATPVGSQQDDAVLERWCAAADHLIEQVPAPDHGALAFKMELAFERSEGFELFDDFKEALLRDVRGLGAEA